MLGGDFAGFPNGRRLEDDVTDIELRALTCGYGTTVGPRSRTSASAPGTPTARRTTMLGDGVDVNDRPFHTTFPYVPEPHQGYQHVHHGAPGGP